LARQILMGGLWIECWAAFQDSSTMHLMLRIYYMRTHCFSCESKTHKVVLAGSKCIETHGIASTAKFCYTGQKLNDVYILGSFQKLQQP
jgi:hypothetical protein